jgi:hypothetical protein
MKKKKEEKNAESMGIENDIHVAAIDVEDT